MRLTKTRNTTSGGVGVGFGACCRIGSRIHTTFGAAFDAKVGAISDDRFSSGFDAGVLVPYLVPESVLDS